MTSAETNVSSKSKMWWSLKAHATLARKRMQHHIGMKKKKHPPNLKPKKSILPEKKTRTTRSNGTPPLKRSPQSLRMEKTAISRE